MACAASAMESAAGETAIETMRRDVACSAVDQENASARLKTLHDEDQRVRKEHLSFAGDQARRIEVAEIFARGCMRKAEDFFNAAMVYQHGTVPEHYYLAFLWARRAVEMGDRRGAYLVPRAIDRYLINRGQKQLFGSNLVTQRWLHQADDRQGNVENDYWCVFPVEPTFSDQRRAKYGFRPLQESLDWSADKNKQRGSDQGGVQCTAPAKATPAGSIPGFW